MPMVEDVSSGITEAARLARRETTMSVRGAANRAIGRNTEEHEIVKATDSPVGTGIRNLVEETSIIDTNLGCSPKTRAATSAC